MQFSIPHVQRSWSRSRSRKSTPASEDEIKIERPFSPRFRKKRSRSLQEKLENIQMEGVEWNDVWKSLNPSELKQGMHTNRMNSMRDAAKNTKATDEGPKTFGISPHRCCELLSRFVISQENPFIVKWSIFILGLVIYTTVSTPYLIAIDDGVNEVDSMFIFDRILDVIFFSDLFLQFFITFENSMTGIEEHSVSVIAKHYISLWFWVDLVSIFPYDLIGFVFNDDELGNLSTLSIIRMFRMFKLFKLMTIKRIFEKMEANYAINYDYLELIKYLVAVFFIVHLLACGLMIVGKEENLFGINSWVIEGGFDHSGDSDRYLVAAYWATMTLSTIGYGDVDLVTNLERGYAIFAMLLGASIYAYVVGGICGIILNLNKDREEYKANLNLLNSFMKSISLPKKTQHSVRDFYARTYEFRKTVKQKCVLELLSPQLQAVVGVHMNGQWIMTIPFFQDLSGIVIATLSLSLVPQSYSPREILVQPGEPINMLFILKKGTVLEDFLAIHTIPYYFGREIILSQPARAQIDLRALKYCDTYTLAKDDLDKLLEKYPDANLEISKHARRLAFRRTMIKLKKLYEEGQIDCISDFCNIRHTVLPHTNSFRWGSGGLMSTKSMRSMHLHSGAGILDSYELRMNEMDRKINKILKILESKDPDR